MNAQRVVVVDGWPKPDAGAPSPVVFANDVGSLIIRYQTNTGKFAVIAFRLCFIFTFGSPNDEALAGHPLYSQGLQFYNIHKVENSEWIDLLERRNRVHSKHDPSVFRDRNHYVFTFHDSTLECIVAEGKYWITKVAEFDTESDANLFIEEIRR